MRDLSAGAVRHQKRLNRWVVFVVLVWSLISLPVGAVQRQALVIGNASYQKGALENPGNDAEDVAAALAAWGTAYLRAKRR